MPIYEFTADAAVELPRTTYADAGLRERDDLQRLIRENPRVIVPDVLLIAEEFCDWEDSSRRIDLLGVDVDGNLVVIELKRTEQAGHAELQALRYAAMVSTMTLEKAADCLARFASVSDGVALERLAEHVGGELSEETFAQSVRIVVAAAGFSRELTTAVIWLTGFGLDIRCVALRPYLANGRLLVESRQVLPLPEAADYVVRLAEKKRSERREAASRGGRVTFRVRLGDRDFRRQSKRKAAYLLLRHLFEAGVTPEEVAEAVPGRSFRTVFRAIPGRLSAEEFAAAAATDRSVNQAPYNADRFYAEEGELLHEASRTLAITNQWGSRFEATAAALRERFSGYDFEVVPEADAEL